MASEAVANAVERRGAILSANPSAPAAYSGGCSRCGNLHDLDRSADAIEAARAWIVELERNENVGRDGKMLGVLVGKDCDAVEVTLRAVSGLVDGGDDTASFAGATRHKHLTAGEEARTLRTLARLSAEIERLDVTGAAAALAAARRPFDQQIDRLSTERARGKRLRAPERELLSRQTSEVAAARLLALDRESQRERATIRDLRAQRARETAPLVDDLARKIAARNELRAERRRRSRELQATMHAGHGFVNFAGRYAPLTQLFAPARGIPSGAGECCAPKLLQEAARRGIRPSGMAEFWWGPASETRAPGQFYGPCADKCQPLLGHLLCGADAPRQAVAILYEDESIIVVDKAAGLRSVPGRGSAAQDCVQNRLANVRPDAVFLRAVHRLDQATSGILVFARERHAHRSLSSAFAAGAVDKEYAAVVGGVVAADHGEIRLNLCADIADRPRQIVDERRGKEALTRYRVLNRLPGDTRLALFPTTGRTHQLRVHCAAGIGHAIVGDELYGGTPAARLLLHACRIEFAHPTSGARMVFESSVPF